MSPPIPHHGRRATGTTTLTTAQNEEFDQEELQEDFYLFKISIELFPGTFAEQLNPPELFLSQKSLLHPHERATSQQVHVA